MMLLNASSQPVGTTGDWQQSVRCRLSFAGHHAEAFEKHMHQSIVSAETA